MVESFFGSMQLDLLDRQPWATRQELANAIFEWIEAWYNPRRRHSALGNLSRSTTNDTTPPPRPDHHTKPSGKPGEAQWALVAAWGAWALTRHTGRAPQLLSWLASGFLFAWGSWKAVFSFAVTPEFPPPEQPWVLTLQNHFGTVAGLLILVVVLLTVSDDSERSAAVDGPAPAAL